MGWQLPGVRPEAVLTAICLPTGLPLAEGPTQPGFMSKERRSECRSLVQTEKQVSALKQHGVGMI